MAQPTSWSCELTRSAREEVSLHGGAKHERTILCAFIRSVSFEHGHVSLSKFFKHSMSTCKCAAARCGARPWREASLRFLLSVTRPISCLNNAYPDLPVHLK